MVIDPDNNKSYLLAFHEYRYDMACFSLRVMAVWTLVAGESCRGVEGLFPAKRVRLGSLLHSSNFNKENSLYVLEKTSAIHSKRFLIIEM